MDAGRDSVLEWATAFAPMPGESDTGDLGLVVSTAVGALVAVIDGAGHGPGATRAAQAAASEIVDHRDEPVEHLFELCHEILRRTRGAVMTLASIDAEAQRMSWAGVGDVDGVLVREASPRQWLVARGGVVGFQLPPLYCSSLALAPGDVLILTTDGIQEGFADRLDCRGPATQIVDQVLARSFRGTDDALVLAARYLGPGGRSCS